jgi:hypothetical protein
MSQGAWLNWVGVILATPVVFWAGWPFFERPDFHRQSKPEHVLPVMASVPRNLQRGGNVCTRSPDSRMHGVVPT